MRRRKCLKTILAGVCAATAPAASQQHAIQLHVDLSVDPSQERDMLHSFQVWPAIEKTLASKNYTVLLYDEV